MAFFIISENGLGDVFEMDATVTQSYNLSASVTKYAVESGSKSSDHYNKDLIKLNYAGVVTDVKYLHGVELSQDVVDFEKGIVDLRDSGVFFASNFSDDIGQVKNCLFTGLTITRTVERGRYAIDVSFSIEQVNVVDQAEVTTAPKPFETFVDPAEDKKKSAGSTDEVPERERDGLDKAVDFLTGGAVTRTDFLR